MENPLNIKIGDRIKDFFESGDFIVTGFEIVTEDNYKVNPITMKRYQNKGEFWAISVHSCPENDFKCTHLVPLDMIKKENV